MREGPTARSRAVQPGARLDARGAEGQHGCVHGDRYDVIVVGAGPAGSAAALAALLDAPGSRVLMLDRAPLGRDKICGDGIPLHTVTELDALGVAAAEPDERVHAVRLSAPALARTAAVATSPSYVVPRATFDARLLRQAIHAGATFVQEKVTTVVQDDSEVTVNGRYSAPVLIGADGSNSVVRRLAGQPSNRGRSLAVAIRGYAPTPPGAPNELGIRWDAGRAAPSYAWVFPTAHGVSNIGYGASLAAITGGRAELVSRLRALLPDYPVDDTVLTGHTLPLATARVARAVGRILLVGDAASLVNPLSGEGIHTAVASGALAGTLAATRPAEAGRAYVRGLRRRFAGQEMQLRSLSPLLESRAVLGMVLRACRADPRVFERLLQVGLGDRSFRPVDAVRILRHLRPRDGE
jgi:geranylgeranyl reductase family protein